VCWRSKANDQRPALEGSRDTASEQSHGDAGADAETLPFTLFGDIKPALDSTCTSQPVASGVIERLNRAR
jgi:hypothetical protein